MHLNNFFWSAPVAFRRVALETPEWTSRDSNHRQSVSAGKTNAIPTEPSGRLKQMHLNKTRQETESRGEPAQSADRYTSTEAKSQWYLGAAGKWCGHYTQGNNRTKHTRNTKKKQNKTPTTRTQKGRGLTGALESDSPAHLITDSPAHRIQTHPHKIQTHLRTRHLEREKPTFRFIN